MAKPLILIEGLIKNYSIGTVTSQILKNISLQVNQGDLLAIVGASGSGKSTLMNIMGLLDKADAGKYFLNGQNVALLEQDALAELRNRQIGFVFQQFNLLSRLTAEQNVALPLTYRQLHQSDIKSRVMQALQRVGMESYAHHRPTQLSGGQQQRVAIARALVGDPTVIMADEPTGALDSKTGTDVLNLFLELHQEGRTILIITHDENIAATCSRRLVLADGQIIAEQHHDAA